MTVLEVRDGVDATASVLEYGGGARVLFVNGKPDASNGVDMLTQDMIGHLPLLAHPQARQVLVIGMGSGVTVGAVARHPVESIEVVEISPEVLDLGTRWFAAENHDVVHDPRLVVHLEDGRNFVAFNEDRLWDVIVSEPSNPWMTGAASLFTDEFFAQALRRLRPDGILAQWFHVYSMAIEDVRVLLATVHRHFDHVYVFTLFEVDQRGDMVVLASNRALDFTPVLAALRGHGPAGDDLRELRFDATRLLQSFVLAPENLDAFVRGTAVNSDDRPVIELDAPRSVFLDTVRANLEALHRASGGARLPLAGADELAAGFRIAPPSGFRRSFSGFRNRLVPAASPDARPLRGIATDVEFEDDGGRRLEVLGERGERDAGALATMAAGGPATIVGDATVDDHPAAVYALPDGATTVAWTCNDSGFSYAATLRGAADRDAAVALLTTGGLRCHAGDEPAR
jgi:spermidine synthase